MNPERIAKMIHDNLSINNGIISEGLYIDAGKSIDDIEIALDMNDDPYRDWMHIRVENKPYLYTYTKDVGHTQIIYYYGYAFEPMPSSEMKPDIVGQKLPIFFDKNGKTTPYNNLTPAASKLIKVASKRRVGEKWEAVANRIRDKISHYLRAHYEDPGVQFMISNAVDKLKGQFGHFDLIVYPKSSTDLSTALAIKLSDTYDGDVVEIHKEENVTLSEDDKTKLNEAYRKLSDAEGRLDAGEDLTHIDTLPILVLDVQAANKFDQSIAQVVLSPEFLNLSTGIYVESKSSDDVAIALLRMPCPSCQQKDWMGVGGLNRIVCKACNFAFVPSDPMQLEDMKGYINSIKPGTFGISKKVANRPSKPKAEPKAYINVTRDDVAQAAKKVVSDTEGTLWAYNQAYQINNGVFGVADTHYRYDIKGALEHIATVNALKIIREKQSAAGWKISSKMLRKGKSFSHVFEDINRWIIEYAKSLISKALEGRPVSYGKSIERGAEFLMAYKANEALVDSIASLRKQGSAGAEVLIVDDNIKSGSTMLDIARVISQIAKEKNVRISRIIFFALYFLNISEHIPPNMEIPKEIDPVSNKMIPRVPPATLPEVPKTPTESIIDKKSDSQWVPGRWNPEEIASMITENPDVNSAKPIESFHGPHRFLSNFWPAEVALDKYLYPSVEHAYQAAKTTDESMRRQIRHTEKPGDVKKLGRKLAIRPDWEAVKLQVMEDLVRQKFTRHPDLKAKLLATGAAELKEGNTWNDTYWGISLKSGEGQNHLGKILMKVRDELRGSHEQIVQKDADT